MGRYNPATPIRLSGEFRVGGALTDPGAVTIKVVDPAGAETTPTAQKSGTGIYYADLEPALEGLWHYRFEGTAPAPGVAEGAFAIRSDYR